MLTQHYRIFQNACTNLAGDKRENWHVTNLQDDGRQNIGIRVALPKAQHLLLGPSVKEPTLRAEGEGIRRRQVRVAALEHATRLVEGKGVRVRAVVLYECLEILGTSGEVKVDDTH